MVDMDGDTAVDGDNGVGGGRSPGDEDVVEPQCFVQKTFRSPNVGADLSLAPKEIYTSYAGVGLWASFDVVDEYS
uniref:Uncharacterized protein n=1 Tax=Tanacetum cinerariifolium TaxID=118510 RepID=A0A699I133_TANCI|nr:hypothetical protein [Tanacetum cinerariifolium]